MIAVMQGVLSAIFFNSAYNYLLSQKVKKEAAFFHGMIGTVLLGAFIWLILKSFGISYDV